MHFDNVLRVYPNTLCIFLIYTMGIQWASTEASA
jgi:hypothetical protein